MLITFLLVVQVLVALALVGVILMQRSEGGGLGIGGSPAGLMSARGAADFLTRTTTILAALFIALCIIMAGLAAGSRSATKLDTSLIKPATTTTAPVAPSKPGAPLTTGDNLSAFNAQPVSTSASTPAMNTATPAPANAKK